MDRIGSYRILSNNQYHVCLSIIDLNGGRGNVALNKDIIFSCRWGGRGGKAGSMDGGQDSTH